MFKLDKSLCPDADRKYECVAFTLESLIAWLETKDPAAEYNFFCAEAGCLWAQYTLANGGEVIDGDQYKIRGTVMPYLDPGTWQGDIAVSIPRTFGAALSRARKYVAGTP